MYGAIILKVGGRKMAKYIAYEMEKCFLQILET